MRKTILFMAFVSISFLVSSQIDSTKIVEKVYLHIDRVSYYPGDDIWFKAYLIDATDKLLTTNSINLHVELISPDLKIVDSRVVKLDNGLGNGDFHLSEKQKSGRYIVRAYTNYMRNFGEKLFFNKEITIINPSDAAKTFSDSSDYKTQSPGIAFFPEGGSLVENVSSLVAFKAMDDNGNGHNISGVIYSSDGDKVTEFRSTHNGMGSFSLTSGPGLKYFALIQTRNGDSLKYELPKSFPTGVVLAISENRKKELAISFRTNSQTLSSILDRDLSLAVSARNTQLKTYSFRMKSLNSFFNLPTDDLPEGIVMLTLFGEDNKPLSERLVYIQNNEEVKVKVEAEKSVCRQRDSVSLKVSLLVNSTIPQDAFLSLSAIDNLFTDNSSRFPSNISSWFLLESDVRGPVEEPSYYFDPSNPDRLKDLDLLLLTQGWRDFEWKYKTMIYPPENGFTISGRVRKKFVNTPIKNSVVNIAIFNGRKPLIFFIPVDSLGKFTIGGIDQMGPAKIVASITDNKDNLKGLLIMDSLKYVPELVKSDMFKLWISSGNQDQKNGSGNDLFIEENLQAFIQYSESKLSVQRKYKLSDTIMPGEVMITAKRQDAFESPRARSRRYLMGTPDREVEITPTLEAYRNAYILVKYRYCSQFHVIGIPGLARGEDLDPGMHNPMFLIDGAYATRADVEAIPIKWVKRLDILDNPVSWAQWKNMMRSSDSDSTSGSVDGVVSIILKDDSEIEWPVPSHSSKINFSGYNEPRIFYSPRHHTKLESDYKPDLRTTLYWEPNIKVENNKEVLLNYFNADNPSKVKVIVEGITTAGIPVTGKTEYEVK